jgi:hypothetical protein
VALQRDVWSTEVKLAEAAEAIDRKVVWCPRLGSPKEEGVITSVNSTFVFVRYGSDQHSKATRPQELELVTP